jgi:Putative tail fiber protein gp53-like, C-terminal
MSFSYNNQIPVAPNNPSADQPGMLTNAQSINSIIAVDHIGFNTNNGGYHTVIHFSNQAADPPNIAGVGQLYTKSAGNPSQPALFYRPPTSAAGIQLTNLLLPVANTNGYTFLPGGLIFQWGTVTTAFSGSSSRTGGVVFSSANVGFPSNCFNVQATLSGTSGHADTLQINSVSAAGFSWQFTSVPNTTSYTGFSWVAIGN